MVGLLSSLEASVPVLRSYATTLLGDRHDADELVYACLVAAINRMQARQQLPPQVWLLGLLHREGVDRLRRKGIRWQPTSVNAAQAAAQDDPVEPETGKGPDETLGAFEKLPVELRSVLFLVSVAELSYATVAEVLGVSIETVMSLLSDGRRRLRAHSSGSEARPAARRLA